MKREEIHIMTAQVYEGMLYGACYEINALCKTNMSTGDMEIIGKFPEEKCLEKALYRDSVIIENKIYFIPDKAKKMAVYDVIKDEFVMIEIPNDQGEQRGYDAVLYEKNIVLIPLEIKKGIMMFDTENKIFKNVDGVNEKILTLLHGEEKRFVLRVIKIENKMVLPVNGTDIYMEIDLPEWKVEVRQLCGEKVKGVLPGEKGYMVLVEAGKCIYECEKAEVKKIEFADRSQIIPVFNHMDRLVMFNKEIPQIELLLKNEEKHLELENKDKMKIKVLNDLIFFREAEEKNRNILYSLNLNGIILSSKDRIEFVETHCSNIEVILKKYMHEAIAHEENIICENIVNLQDYLEYLNSSE